MKGFWVVSHLGAEPGTYGTGMTSYQHPLTLCFPAITGFLATLLVATTTPTTTR